MNRETAPAEGLPENGARLSVVGLGPGDVDYLTPRARGLIECCDVLIGSPRQLDCFPDIHQQKRPLDASLPVLAAWLDAHREQRVGVLA